MAFADSADQPLTALDVARFICRRSGWQVTNLALQKILYVLQMIHLGRTGVPLFRGEFQAWDFGPVEPKVYRTVSMFGNEPIKDVFIYRGAKDPSDPKDVSFLEEGCDFLLQKTAGQLVSITHWKDGAWAKNYQPGVKGIRIPNSDILEEYHKRDDGNRSTEDRAERQP
jgi:uncharacterized phage-associated protein